MPNKIEHSIPLSKLHYENKGVSIPWNAVNLFIPYRKLKLDIWMDIIPDAGNVQRLVIDPQSKALEELSNAAKLIKQFQREIKPLVIERRLTLELARDILEKLKIKHNKPNWSIKDDCLHQLLVKTIELLTPEREDEVFTIPLSELRYSQNGVSCRHGLACYRVPKDRLMGFVPYLGFNRIRNLMKGNATFTRRSDTLLRWDPDTANLEVGQTSVKTVMGQIVLENSGEFKKLLCLEICKIFNGYKVRNIDRLLKLIALWGISPDDEEAGQMIVSRLTTRTKKRQMHPVALKEVIFGSINIIVRLEGKRLTIPSTKFRFKTHPAFKKMKNDLQVFDKFARVWFDRYSRFRWSYQAPHYHLKMTRLRVQKVTADPRVVKELNNIHIPNVLIASPSRSGPTIRNGPTIPRVKHIKKPTPYLAALEQKAKSIHFTPKGYWFHIEKISADKDRLIWEVNTEKLATFIFALPEDMVLTSMIERIINMPRRNIPINPSIGYVARVVHPHKDFDTWKDNVWKTL